MLFRLTSAMATLIPEYVMSKSVANCLPNAVCRLKQTSNAAVMARRVTIV